MKKIKYLIYSLICFSLSLTNVYARSIEMYVTSKVITKGTNITVTAKFTSENSIFFTEGDLVCKGAGVEKSVSLKDDDMSDGKKEKSFSLSITPTSAGEVKCSVVNAKLTDSASDSWKTVTTSVLTITVNNPVQTPSTPKVKSSNNYLSSLTLEGLTLDKEFNKDTLEYTVTAPAETTKVKINAQTADSSSKVEGTGEKDVTTGSNTFEIKVTAENASVKTYKLTVIVKEAVTVKVNDKEYSIINENNSLDVPEGYEKKTIKINDDDVTSYYNEKTKYNLLLLKDDEDNYNYYLYENDTYSLYKEYNFSGTRLYLLEAKFPDNYVERELIVNDEKIKAYQLDPNKKNATYALDSDLVSNYYLVYAMNINTGNTNYYLIDKLENTAIRYDEELNNLFLDIEKEDNYKTYFFIALIALGVVTISFGISLIVKGRKKKNKLNFK